MNKEQLIFLIDNLMKDFDPYSYEDISFDFEPLAYIEDILDNDPKAIKDYCYMVLDECEDYDLILKAKTILKEID